MPKRAKQEKKRIPIDISIVSEESLSNGNGTRGAAASPVSMYGQLLGERNRYVDARHGAQQRVDQIAAATAAGALVLSITFMNGIAPAPAARTAWLLAAGWAALVTALGVSLTHHHLAQRAVDDYVRELDRAFGVREIPASTGAVARLPLVASLALLAGILCLAVFAFVNLRFA